MSIEMHFEVMRSLDNTSYIWIQMLTTSYTHYLAQFTRKKRYRLKWRPFSKATHGDNANNNNKQTTQEKKKNDE